MKNTKLNQVLNLIKENPKITYEEINKRLNLPDTAKVYVYRLKNKGTLEQITNEDGIKEFIVSEEVEDSMISKKLIYEEMIEIYMQDFINAPTFKERVEIGREIRLIIERF